MEEMDQMRGLQTGPLGLALLLPTLSLPTLLLLLLLLLVLLLPLLLPNG
jgi:hypothetical protein